MLPDNNGRKRLAYDPDKLKSTLDKIPDQGPWQDDVTSFDLIQHLRENGLLNDKFSENLVKWPEPVQTYIKKEFLGYVRASKKEYKEVDLQVVNDFFETALQEPDNCAESKFPRDKLEQAMSALAQQLRHYYGAEENDEELPCWPFIR
jgi:hypothetical protein